MNSVFVFSVISEGPFIKSCASDITSYETNPVWDYPESIQPDLSSPAPNMTCSDQPGTSYEYGTTNYVTCSATDKYGNSASCSFNIFIVSKTQAEIANLTAKNVTNENVNQVATDLESITEDPEDLSSEDIVVVTNLLEDIVSVESPDEEVTEAVVGTVDNLLQGAEDDDAEITPETSASILNSLEEQLNTSASAGYNVTQDKETLGVQTLSVRKRSLNNGITFGVSQTEDGNRTVGNSINKNQGEKSNPETTITLPQWLLDVGGKQLTNISFAAYYNDVLFPATTVPTLNVSDVIISATIYDNSHPDVFKEPVLIQFNRYSKAVNFTCVYWDENLGAYGDWSTIGCEGEADMHSVTCKCTHLTSFAVLVSRPNYLSADSPSNFDLILTIVTYVGCAVSIVCLIMTIAIILSLK
ncbi:adhesion G-protein coupled receptor G7-like [Anneissia japonica]|uniref:adhesion G-protein coupled receptor G7-like n=1 Tax=Anneissia japonica TaxID=1529436 RepID=UPI001425A3A6|nr:adhesion G-protein coupled receptor G7-like [Anneissia japonica]